MTYKSLLLCFSMVALSACSVVPDSAYSNRAQPESLLDVSVEQVTVPLDTAQGVDDLVAWLDQSQPSQAMLQCAQSNDMLCINAKRLLSDFAVPVNEEMSAGGSQVVLVYENLMAQDCDQRYVDRVHNPYNISHESFGCSVAANSVQMVSDKRQFINPALLGYMDGSRAGKVYHNSMTLPPLIEKNQGSVVDDVTAE